MSWQDKLNKMKIKHTFNGWEFDYDTLKNTEVLKIYKDTSHFERKLIKHKETGKLFLYEFYEYVNFSGGNDEMYETFTIVSDEVDADELNSQRFIKRTPFIFVDDQFNITISE